MGRNFENQEIASLPTGRQAPLGKLGARNDRSGNRLTALAFAIASAATIASLPTEAQAQTGPSIEFEELNVTLKGTVLGDVLVVSGETGGWFSSTKGTLRIPLAGVVAADELAKLEGHEVEVEIKGKKEGGVFRGEIRTTSGFALPMPLTLDNLGTFGLRRIPGSCAEPSSDCSPRSRSCDKRSAAKPSTKPLAPEPGEVGTDLVRLRKPFDPGTFYVDKPETGKSMGQGHPRGFDVEKDGSITFFVTGDKSGNTRVSLELYPWVPINEKKRAESANMKVKVTIDDEEYEIVPQPLPKGKILPATKTGEVALWDTPLRLARIPIPAGTHEITVTSVDSHFRAVLRGADETSKPEVDAAIERPFEEDPNFPPEFDMNALLVTAAEEPSGYKLESITKSPVKLDKIHIERIQNSTLVRVRLIMGDITYESEKPLMPQTDHRIKFTRETPPARSTDSEGPDELPLHVTVTGNDRDGYEGKVDGSMTCQTTRRANLHCWKKSEDESRVRAFRTRLDTRPTNPAGQPRRHILRKY